MAAADILIEIYMAESTVLRTEKLAKKQGENKVQEQIAMAKLYLYKAVDVITQKGKESIISFAEGDEQRMMLMGFAAREAIHIAAYSHLIETLGLPDKTYNEFMQYQEMKDKHDYVMNISGKNGTKENTARHIAVFSAFTEGMQLFSSFIMLLNFPRTGKMKGMGQIITWSIVDETMHSESMMKLFKTYIHENTEIWNDELKSSIYTIAEKMVELEDKFIDLAFSMGEMEGLNSEDVKKYIRYIADRRLIGLGMKGIYKVKKNPLPWVEEMINAPTHTNFFENRATDYAKGALSGNWDQVWA